MTALLMTMALVAACENKNDQSTTSRPSGTAPSATTPSTPPKADNTARNKGDHENQSRTPMDQSNASIDVKITAEIRRAIMDDKTMSVNAQNCKIITDKAGVVTLRGPVDTRGERESIEAKARAVAGVTSVINELEVKQ